MSMLSRPDRGRVVRRILAAQAFALCAAIAGAHAADDVAVEVTNRSVPVLCAEKDNVTIAFSAPGVRSFRIEAAHPAYLGQMQRDSFEPDWTACDMTGDPAFKPAAAPRRVTLYEEPGLWVVGHTQESFWRPATARVRIGDRVERDIHLLQVWMIRPMGGEEVVVLYPQDGYWRLRPLAPEGMAPTAFGSSFLIGPIGEQAGRPMVDIDEVAFDPQSRTFALSFKGGGSASVRMVRTDRRMSTLDVTFDRPAAERPFAMLRSMYVTAFNNDIAAVAVREPGALGWLEASVMDFKRATAADVWLGRLVMSRHNTSSPDMVFSRFSNAPAAVAP
jgi:hypothetical protein